MKKWPIKKWIGAAALLLSCSLHPALADDASDSRIKLLMYNDSDVYTVITKYGYQTNIVFGPSEEIQTISVGDRSLWQIIPAGHRLFIRPMEDGADTNMTVITNKHSYQFDLKAVKDEKSNANIYVARFVYPDEKSSAMPQTGIIPPVASAPHPMLPPVASAMPNVPPAAMPAPETSAANAVPPPIAAPETAASVPPSAAAPVSNAEQGNASENPATINYNYTFSGPDDLAPLKVYDDGHTTFFKYRDTTQPFPNVYILNAQGKETLTTPYRSKEGYMAVDSVAGEFALKSSAGTIHVYNEMLNPPK